MVARSGRLYVDASALVKAIVTERESQALVAVLADASGQVSSRLLAIEVTRAAGRVNAEVARRAAEVLDAVDLIELDAAIAAAAAKAAPATLRSLDAIHLASALSVQDDIDAVVTYDARLADAARLAGLTVLSPA